MTGITLSTIDHQLSPHCLYKGGCAAGSGAICGEDIPTPARRLHPPIAFIGTLSMLGHLLLNSACAQTAAPSIAAFEASMSAVLMARRLATESAVNNIALQLTDLSEALPTGSPDATSGLRRPPPGPVNGSGISTHPLFDSHKFFYPPDRIADAVDANGNRLAYCAFDLSGTASSGRLPGHRPAGQGPSPQAVAAVIISPGANGQFELTCSDFKTLDPGQRPQRSGSKTVGSDDVYTIITHAEMTVTGQQSSFFGSPVANITDLRRLGTTASAGGVFTGQVRLVRNLNQLFVATVSAGSAGDTVSWSLLTPSLMRSSPQLNQADFAWMSGGISIGHTVGVARPDVPGSNEPTGLISALTLGTRRLLADGVSVEHGILQSGLGLMDSRGNAAGAPALRAWTGLTGTGQQAFVIRHGTGASSDSGVPTYRDRLRIEGDGRLWLGDIPAISSSTGGLPAFPGSVAAATFAGNTAIFTDAATTTTGNGYLLLGQRNESSYDVAQAAGLRFFSSGKDSGMELRMLDFSSSLPVTGNGSILLNTTGRTGIAHAPGSALTHTLDVNGSMRVRGVLQVDASTLPNVAILTDGGNVDRIQLQTADGARRLALGMSTSGNNSRAWLRLNGVDLLNMATESSGTSETTVTTLNTAMQANRRFTIGPDSSESGNILIVNGASRFEGPLRIGANLSVPASSPPYLATLGSLSATTATFSNLTAGDALMVSGRVTANNGLTVANAALTAAAGLSASDAVFSGLLAAQAGLTVNDSRLLANAGLTVTGDLAANAGLDVLNNTRVRSNLTVKGNLAVGGNLTVTGGIRGLSDIRLTFYGYPANNTSPTELTEIGSGTLSFTSINTIALGQANRYLYDINQALASSATPTFNGVTLRSGGLRSEGDITGNGGLEGALVGKATSALAIANRRIIVQLKRETTDTLPYDVQVIDLSDARTNKHVADFIVHAGVNNLTPSGFSKPTNHLPEDKREVTLSKFTKDLTVTYTCNNNDYPAAKADPTIDPCASAYTADDRKTIEDRITLALNQNSFKESNTVNTLLNTDNVNKPNPEANNTPLSRTITLPSLRPTPTATMAKLVVTSNFMSSNTTAQAPLTLDYGKDNTLTLTLNEGYARAHRLDQALNQASAVTFARLTSGSLTTEGTLTAQNMTVAQSGTQTGTISSPRVTVFDNSGNATISLDGSGRTMRIGRAVFDGNNARVIANRFEGTADAADALSEIVGLNFTGALSATTSVNDSKTHYVINTRLNPSAITLNKLADSSITGQQIGNAAIGADAISSNTLTDRHFGPGIIVTKQIGNDSVELGKLARGAVTQAKLASGAVTSSDLKPDAVTTPKIRNNTVQENDFDADLRSRLVSTSSDMRLKADIIRVDGNRLIENIAGLRAYGFQFSDDASARRRLGVLAQELQPLLPELVSVQTDGMHAGYLRVDFNMLTTIAAAGVGELARRLNETGLVRTSADTLQATRRQLLARRIESEQVTVERLVTQHLQVKELAADEADIGRLEAQKVSARQWQSETARSGSAEGFGAGAGLTLFSAVEDGHYLVTISANDGSHISALAVVTGGQLLITRQSGSGISLLSHMGMVYAYGPGKLMKATWLKTG